MAKRHVTRRREPAVVVFARCFCRHLSLEAPRGSGKPRYIMRKSSLKDR
jgi:hypothetical protein